jgi:hypothetical protein
MRNAGTTPRLRTLMTIVVIWPAAARTSIYRRGIDRAEIVDTSITAARP